MFQSATKQAMVNRRYHRGFNDLLSYLMMLDDCTILHKDGALSRHYQYIAPDLDSSNSTSLDYHAESWRRAMTFLGNGWMIECNVLSEPFDYYSQPREFPDVVSALIDDERRLQYQGGHYFKSTFYLSITWRPENKVASSLKRFAMTPTDQQKDWLAENLEAFDHTVNECTQYLQRSLLSLTPLSGDQLTSFLYQSMTGKTQGLVKPYLGAFLDCYLSNEDFIGGFSPKIGDQHICILAIDDLPAYSYPCILDDLSYMPIQYRWSNRFITLDALTAKSYLKRYERNWSSKAIGVLGVIREAMGNAPKIDEDAQRTADLLKMAQIDNASGELGYGFYNSTLIFMHEDLNLLEKITDDILSKIQQRNFRVRKESVNATEAYLGSLPCHGDYNLRKMMVDTQFMSHAFPTSTVYQGDPISPCPMSGYKNEVALLFTATRGSRPFMLNLHVGDVGHTAVLGPTGSGKTTLNALLMASHRKYTGSRIIVLDKDFSNRLTIQALGGNYYDLSVGTCQIAPLSRVSPKNSEQIDKAVEWLIDCCRVQNVLMTPSKQKLLRESVERLSVEEAHYKNLDHLALQDLELREAIDAFNRGSFQQFLNGTATAFSKTDVLGIDMSAFVKPDTHEHDLNIPIIKAIFNELEAIFKDKRPTLLILEEAWLYLRHPLFREKLTDWFKTLRKANVSVIFVSQDLDDIVKSNAASAIQSACMTRIYLPNAAAGEAHMKNLYQAFGLNDTEIDILRQATLKRDYYYHSPKGNRLFSLDLGPLATTLLCISSKEDQAYFEQVFNAKKPDWIIDWLTYKGLPQWVDFVKKHYMTMGVVR